MKLVRNILNKIKPHFEKGGKLEKLYPAYDAFETMAFVPAHTTETGSHLRDSIDLKRTMITVIIALIPALIFGMWNVGHLHYQALEGMSTEKVEAASLFNKFLFGFWKMIPLIVVSYGVGLTIEFAFAISRGHSVNEGYLVTGLLIPMIMPIDIPLWMLALSVAFAVIIGKEVFGGTGMNILNPALTARAFLFFAYPVQMSGDRVWIADMADKPDAFSGATPLAELAGDKITMDSTATLLQYTSESTSYLPNTVNEYTYSISDMFLGYIPGSASETSMLAILIGAAILLITGIGSWRTMFSVFVGGYVMAILFNVLGANGTNQLMLLPAHLHLILGGFAFGAVFMATDPVTASQTNKGKYIVGFLIGFLAILIRVFNPAYPEGMMLAILFMNIFAPLVDHYVIQGNIKKRMKRIKK